MSPVQVQPVAGDLLALKVIQNVRILIGGRLGHPVVKQKDDDEQHHHRDADIQQQVS